MYWYAAEPLIASDAPRAAALAAASPILRIQEFTARRIAALGTPESLALLVGELGRAAESSRRLKLLVGIEEALRGRRQVSMPAAWPGVYKILSSDPDAAVRSRAVALGVNFGDSAAQDSLRRVLADSKASPGDRRQAMQALLKVKDPRLVTVLHSLVRHPQLGGPAVRGLSSFDDPATPDVLIDAYPALGPAERRDVLSTLASRKVACRTLLTAVQAGKVPRTDLTADLVRQVRNLDDTELTAQLGRVWGTVRETSGDRARLIAHTRTMLTAKHEVVPNASLGRAVFAKVCQHRPRFGRGGDGRRGRRFTPRRRRLALPLHALEIDLGAAMRADDRSLAEVVETPAAGWHWRLVPSLVLRMNFLWARRSGRPTAGRLIAEPVALRPLLAAAPQPGRRHSVEVSSSFRFNMAGGRACPPGVTLGRGLEPSSARPYFFCPAPHMRTGRVATAAGRVVQRRAGSAERLKGASNMVRVTALSSPFLLGFAASSVHSTRH